MDDSARLEAVAEAIKKAANVYLSQEDYRRVAQAAIDSLLFEQEWGVDGKYPVDEYNPLSRLTAEQIAEWRNTRGIPAHVVSRLVSPWVRSDA